MSADGIILQGPGSEGSALNADQHRAQAAARVKAASARTPVEWMEIYIELIETDLRRIEKEQGTNREIFSAYVSNTRPRLRRIGRQLQAAGLSLVDELRIIEPVVDIHSGDVLWGAPMRCVFLWPDGQTCVFVEEAAGSAFAFFSWWKQFQDVTMRELLVAQSKPTTRILESGDPGYEAYMRAKHKDQQQGLEPPT